MNKTIQYAIAATCGALEDARIDAADPASMEHYGLALGVDGIQYSAEDFLLATYAASGEDMAYYASAAEGNEKQSIKTRDPHLTVHPLWPLTVLPNMSLSHISMLQKIQGPNIVFSSIDAAGAQASGQAFKSIRIGESVVYLAGGSYALNTIHLLSFSTHQLLSQNSDPQQACRPFDCSRDGSVLGEGAVMLVIEELTHALQRGASIYAEIIGYSTYFNGLNSCLSVGRDTPDWQGMHDCMVAAIRDAGIAPAEVNYITADGKATVWGDRMEAQAIRETFNDTGSRIPVSTYKSALGHLLPAAGAASAAITALSISNGIIPPTQNHTATDSQCTLNIVGQAPCRHEIHYALSNTFGFTGENTSLVFKHYN